MAEPKAKKPFHEVVAENLIAQLKEGTAPWQKPWNPGAPGAALPMNPTTGKRYRGINAIHLMAQGYGDQRWMTYKQATAADAQVRKGEKGTLVQYWKFTEERLKKNDDGTIVIGKDDQPVKEIVQLERPKVFNAVVFNAEQIDGLPPLTVSKEKSWNSIERAEDILKASGAIIRHDQADRAFYRMSTDSIHLPQKEAFPAADRYYATALHELGHWTGHTSRLDRDLAHPFGSEGYAKEELRAEIASMIMGDELGIGHDPSQHVAYVKSWIKALQDDPLEIFRAAADAEKIQGYVLGLEQQRTQEQPVTLAQEQRSKEHAEVMGEIQRLTNPDNVDAETVQLFRDTFNTFERTAQEADYVAYYSWGDSELGDQIIRINYEDSNGNTLPVHTDVVGRGKALTYIGEERVPGTAFSSDNEWQSNALKTAFASMDKNVALAAKNVRDQAESISGDPRELPEDVKFPKNWLPNSSLLESGSTERSNSQTAAGAEMTTQAETVTPEQQRRNRAEKFILSNLDGGLADHVSRMNRSQLALSREVLFDAQSSEPNSDFWQRNGEFLASFSQNWPDAKEKIDAAYKELDFATSLLPAKKYLVADNPGANEKLNFVLETNSAIKALAAVNEGENRAVHDSRILGNNQIDLNDRQGNFYQTLDAEKAAIAQGIMTLDEEMNVLPPQDAQEWYQNSVESILEGAEAPTEAYSAMEALGPEPGELEAVFLSDMGQRVIPEVSLNIAQENTPIKVPYQERNEAKALGAKWDRSEQTWFVPAGVSLDKFTKWNGGEAAAAAQDVPPQKATPDRSAERQELAVPYKDRAEAKAAGAKWDKEKKTWYAEAGADMEKLAKWKLENVKVEQSPAMTLQEEVETALKNVGCILDADTDRGQKHPIMDGEGHRITVEGDKKGEKSGFYIIHTDGHPAGFMQNNRTKEELRWSSKGYVQTDEEKALLRAQAAQKQAEKAAQQQKDHDASAKRVGKQLGQLSEPQQQTAYLEKKGLPVHKGVFTDKGGDKTYIPAYDVSGKQWTMQYINEDGTKRFAKNARKEGCFHVVGGLEALKDAPVLIIAEGYATAGSIAEATQYPTVAAFDSGNLEPVAKALKEAFPDKPIVIAGDDDVAQSCKMKAKGKATVNVGREKALETAKAVGGVAVFPIFAKGEVPSKDELSLIKPTAYMAHQTALRKLEAHASGDKPLGEAEVKLLEAARLTEAQQEILKRAERHTDFNDLAVNSSLGRDGVAMQIKAVITSQLTQHQSQGQKKVEKRVQAQEKKRTARHSM
ncbi:zincin-like metallopeptidase domain-containing protein [Scandinavium goeteborgense]|uniref:Antirestriction protein ArdC n=1 Tax=Scandinavium goeteborgense TaxID=1851514 RepID=A0A4R6DUH9_SCAGO|nr:zincin-like metallopeptidase domain-containing protein [Scandinavium goeteborgense]TDN48860.1 antirestriction protein ArdC [Scandinavium goeteborgense]